MRHSALPLVSSQWEMKFVPNFSFSKNSYVSNCTEDYRYGMNGKEADNETSTYDYGFRIYNARLARFLSVDPLTDKYAMLTPYQFASNIPTSGIDLDGLEYVPATLVNDEFYADLGITFESDIQKQEWITAHTVMHTDPSTGITTSYINVGFHVYQDQTTSKFYSTEGEGRKQVSEWVYTDIQLFDETKHQLSTWQDPDVSGSTTIGGKEKINNENCAYLAVHQARELGTEPQSQPLPSPGTAISAYNGTTDTWESGQAAIDYINRELEAGRAVVVGIDYEKGSTDGRGTDHFITITGRTQDANGDNVFLFLDNRRIGDAGVKDFNNNKLVVNKDTNEISGVNNAIGGKMQKVTRVQKNKQPANTE